MAKTTEVVQVVRQLVSWVTNDMSSWTPRLLLQVAVSANMSEKLAQADLEKNCPLNSHGS